MLELATPAVLTVVGEITVSNELRGLTFAPIVYGHLENGDEAVVYRQQALEEIYYGGDLVSWQRQLVHTPGKGRVIHGRAVPIPGP